MHSAKKNVIRGIIPHELDLLLTAEATALGISRNELCRNILLEAAEKQSGANESTPQSRTKQQDNGEEATPHP